MNSRDQEQVNLYKSYLLEKANRSPSRLVRDQIRRWLDHADASRDKVDEGERQDDYRAWLKKAA